MSAERSHARGATGTFPGLATIAAVPMRVAESQAILTDTTP
jgi:hypothetical protein